MRIDKYEPYGGGFRARLAAAWTPADGVGRGVGLDVNGRVVLGAGNTGILGVVVLVAKHKRAGDVVDVMTDGEMLEVTGLAAGTAITALTTDGTLGVTAEDATHTRIGHTVEADRLVVRARR